jgi:hypothetical protein
MKGSSSPSRLEITCRGRSWLGKPVGSPTSAQGHFGRCTPVVAPVYRGTMSRCREGVVHRGDKGGSIAHLSTSPSSEDPCLGRGHLHPLPSRRPSGSTPISLSLPLCARISSPRSCFDSRLTASSGKVAFHGSLRPPQRPYAKL